MTMQKIWDLIREMTLEEKIGMIHGQGIFRTDGTSYFECESYDV